MQRFLCFAFVQLCLLSTQLNAQETRLLRQPTVSASHIAFAHAGDIWVTDLNGENSQRLTSTAAVESHPHFSPRSPSSPQKMQ